MRRLVATAFVVALLSSPLHAQDSAFVNLRRDGNGFPQLTSIVTIAIDRQTADVALRRVAAMARLNLTFDPRLTGLATIVSLPAHSRTVATALIEIADVA